jgi:hypothetical protein
MTLLLGNPIWDRPQPRLRPELSDLIRFQDHWYCGFREACQHDNHPSGRGRVIRSADGERWQSVALFEWDCGDVREPRLSITAEGWLMVNTSVAFVSREARPDLRKPGVARTAYFQLEQPGTPDSNLEPHVMRQSVTWLSRDGLQWSSAHACPTGVNTWRWDVTWFNGMGYSIGYENKGSDRTGTLYRTRDGRSWRVLKGDLFPGGLGNEASLAFDDDATAYCLLRDASLRTRRDRDAGLHTSDGHEIARGQAQRVHGTSLPMLGIGKAPYYQDWTWRTFEVDYGPEHGGVRPAEDLFFADFAGPKLLRLRDGRFVAAARMLGPQRDDGHITVFLLDPQHPRLTLLAECAGTTYGGIVEHDGRLWVTHVKARHLDKIDKPGDERVIHLASLPLP